MQKDLNEDIQASAKSKPAHLDKEQQHELLANIMKYGDDWKMVTQSMGFKTKKEAILEFLRVKPDYEFGTNYLLNHTSNDQPELCKDLKDVEPFN
jgi:hypothetical protein